jgi:hypothetical protein
LAKKWKIVIMTRPQEASSIWLIKASQPSLFSLTSSNFSCFTIFFETTYAFMFPLHKWHSQKFL